MICQYIRNISAPNTEKKDFRSKECSLTLEFQEKFSLRRRKSSLLSCVLIHELLWDLYLLIDVLNIKDKARNCLFPYFCYINSTIN